MDELSVLTWRVPLHEAAFVEAATLPDKERARVLHALRDAAGATELAYLATCQRVALVLLHATPDAGAYVLRAYREALGRDLAPPERHAGRDAFHHLARVASSLDSLVVGEPQILGQVKDAERASEADGVSRAGLRHVFGLIHRAAKAVRAETDLFRGKTSLVPLTEELLEARFAGESAPRVAVLGTGEMGRRMAEWLRRRWPNAHLHVVSRDPARAQSAAQALDAEAHALDAFLDQPPQGLQALVLSMRTEAPVLGAKALEALADGGDLLVIDLALPRNAEPPDPPLPNVRLVQMDELSRISQEGLAQRQREVAHAEGVLERELCRIDDAYAQRHLAPHLQEVARRFQDAAASRLADLPPDLRSDPGFAKWYDQTVRSLLHEATQAIKKVDQRRESP